MITLVAQSHLAWVQSHLAFAESDLAWFEMILLTQDYLFRISWLEFSKYGGKTGLRLTRYLYEPSIIPRKLIS